MARANEADRRARAAPSIACGPAGVVTTAVKFDPISSVVWLNVTVAATVSFHMLDGNTITQVFQPGFFVLEIQCDTITLVSGTATFSALANAS